MSALVLGLLAVLAAAMATSTAVFVRWGAEGTSALRASTVVFLLLMMSGMLGGGLVYELHPDRESAVVGLWLASVVMSASVAIIFVSFLRELGRIADGIAAARPYALGSGMTASVIGLVLVNEGLMGWTFGLAAGAIGRATPVGLVGTLGLLATIVVTPWFTFPMVAEMLLTLLWLRQRLFPAMGWLVLTQPVAMFCSPPTLAGTGWAVGTSVGASAAMAAAIGYPVLLVHRSATLPSAVPRFAARLWLAYGIMAAGIALWAVDGSALLFALAIGVQMVVFLGAILGPPDPDASPETLQTNGHVAAVPSAGP